MSATLATSFVTMVLITMSDGSELQAVGDAYPTFDACMVQAEHDAKIMANEVERIDSDDRIQEIRISCEPGTDEYQPHTGYIPVPRGGVRHE